jgi:hypothetical protein
MRRRYAEERPGLRWPLVAITILGWNAVPP